MYNAFIRERELYYPFIKFLLGLTHEFPFNHLHKLVNFYLKVINACSNRNYLTSRYMGGVPPMKTIF